MDLRPVEERILKAAAKQLSRVEELADAAGCSEQTIYKAMQKPQFRQLFNEALKGQMVVEVPRILKAFADEAVTGSFKHGKLILELAGTYAPPTRRVSADIQGSVEHTGDDSPFGSDEERREYMKEVLQGLALEDEDEVEDDGE